MTTLAPLTPRVGELLERIYAIDEPDHHDWLIGMEATIARSMNAPLAMMSGFYRDNGDETLSYFAATPRAFVQTGALAATADLRVAPVIAALSPVTTMRDAPALSALVPLEALRKDVPDFPAVEDMFGLFAHCTSGIGVAIGALTGAHVTVAPAVRRQWGRVTRHIAAAARLRVHARTPELVMSPNGTALHAEGAATDAHARDALRAAAKAIDRVRGRRVNDPDEALTLWCVLTEGRWSIADRFEENGRRFVVAYANAPAPSAIADGLTLRERQVAALAAFGHSNKEIAYDLAISVSTVAAHLASAMRRLRVKSRMALAAKLRRLAQTPSGNS